ncbi:MAG: hypothetical protein ABUL60_17375 [Myxococcales bacterium]
MARWQAFALSIAVAAGASLSCGGGTTHGDSQTGGAGGVATGGAGSPPVAGASVVASGEPPACSSLPYPMPYVGNPCAADAAPCGCRDDDVAECQTLLVCAAGKYTEQASNCEPPAPDVCPASVEAASEQPCRARDTACPYPGDVACYCAAIYDISGSSSSNCGRPRLSWYCGADYRPAECPEGVPDIGSACTGAQVCGEACFNQYSRACVDGQWERARPVRECL